MTHDHSEYTVVVTGPGERSHGPFEGKAYRVASPADVSDKDGVLIIKALAQPEFISSVGRVYKARPAEQVVYARGAWYKVRIFQPIKEVTP